MKLWILILLPLTGCVCISKHDLHFIKAAERATGYIQGLNDADDLHRKEIKELPRHNFWKETE